MRPVQAPTGVGMTQRGSDQSNILHSPSRVPIFCAKRRADSKPCKAWLEDQSCDASEPLDHQGTGWPRQSKNPPLVSGVN